MGSFASDLLGSSKPVILNNRVPGAPEEPTGGQALQDAVLLLQNLEKMMRRLQGEFLSEDGKSVDYNSMHASTTFQDYQKLSCNLNNIDLKNLSELQRFAFFINVYNLITIHALAVACETEEKVPSSAKEIKDFWRSMSYRISGQTFSLDDIEHGVLRGNRPHPSKASISSTTYFPAEDPRRMYCLSQCDPRIHFALNCGARSCPRISIFNAKDDGSLGRGLEAAAKSFCEENVELDVERGEIRLSKIFDWYGGDFGEKMQKRLEKISGWLDDERKAILEKLMKDGARVTFITYDWNLNSRH